MRISFPDILRCKLIPWSQQNAHQRFVVARPQMKQSALPPGVQLSHRPMAGPRLIVKNKRYYGNVRGCSALWPEARLCESESHKLICTLSGQLTFQLGNYLIECNEGFFILVPPGMPMTDGARMLFHSPGTACDLLTLFLHRHAVQGVITRSSDEVPAEQYKENYLFKSSRLTALLRAMWEEQLERAREADHISATLLAGFWQMLQREFEDERYITPGPVYRPRQPREESANFKDELIDYIEANVSKQLPLEEAARAMHLSRTQFVRRIREETGQTYVEFLTEYRIKEAKALLQDSDWTISAIAGFLGFKTPSYFRTVFLRRTGQTASSYRSQHRS